jgi:hypothetical protein
VQGLVVGVEHGKGGVEGEEDANDDVEQLLAAAAARQQQRQYPRAHAAS